MKRLLTILLALALTLSVCACGTVATNDEVAGKIEPEPTKNASTDEEKTPDKIIGQNTGLVYKNEYFNNQAVLNQEWTLLSDEEIKKLNEEALTTLSEDYAAAMKDADYFTDMSAQASQGLLSINVTIQNMSKIPGAASLTTKSIVASSINGVVESYKNMGFTDVTCEQITAQFCGAECDGLELSAKINGIDFYLKMVVVAKGNYYESITVGALTQDVTDDLLAMFTPLS